MALQEFLEGQARELFCKYPGRRCLKPRAIKRNGDFHRFCETHRQRYCQYQRESNGRRHLRLLGVPQPVDSNIMVNVQLTDEVVQHIIDSISHQDRVSVDAVLAIEQLYEAVTDIQSTPDAARRPSVVITEASLLDDFFRDLDDLENQQGF